MPVELTREDVRVEQRDLADRPATGEDPVQEGTIRVPVRGEEAVVTGEVVIEKERLAERQQGPDTVRTERVEVDAQTDGAGSGERAAREEALMHGSWG